MTLMSILSIIYNYLTGVWACARMIFSALDMTLMKNCLSLLAIVFVIGVIDNLPNFFKFKRKKKKPKDDDEDEWEYIRVRKR